MFDRGVWIREQKRIAALSPQARAREEAVLSAQRDARREANRRAIDARMSGLRMLASAGDVRAAHELANLEETHYYGGHLREEFEAAYARTRVMLSTQGIAVPPAPSAPRVESGCVFDPQAVYSRLREAESGL